MTRIAQRFDYTAKLSACPPCQQTGCNNTTSLPPQIDLCLCSRGLDLWLSAATQKVLVLTLGGYYVLDTLPTFIPK